MGCVEAEPGGRSRIENFGPSNSEETTSNLLPAPRRRFRRRREDGDAYDEDVRDGCRNDGSSNRQCGHMDLLPATSPGLGCQARHLLWAVGGASTEVVFEN